MEINFRRLLKARAMEYNIPIQIVRDRIVKPSKEMQDEATIAWNFFTALYYKASGTPWALKKDATNNTCFAGISFYKSRDKSTTQTSVTQIFNEQGNGVILRGTPVKESKKDKQPHLSEQQAFDLLYNSLKEYYEAVKIYPQRLVIHKSSNYSEEEIEGFEKVAEKMNINSLDLVTIMPTNFRLYREGNYPPLRGTMLSLDKQRHFLYTRGFVDYYGTYPGRYIPSPIEIRLFSYDESPEQICNEILALTKMNWNNTQFDRKFPITIDCSRNVGEILKYLAEDQKPQIKYSFYM
jgi:argonaute-like protein implicated in RNA metabolism and viral defense